LLHKKIVDRNLYFAFALQPNINFRKIIFKEKLFYVLTEI